jgi:hypothetical protein
MIQGSVKKYDGIITKRSVEPSGATMSVDPLTERYDAVAVNTKDVVSVTNHLPARRISKGARVIPAEINDPCDITIVNGKTFLFPYTEGVPFVEAC